jgi:hypothetical protein
VKLVRKQTYLTKEQDLMIKKLAHSRGISEAEVLRSAIDRYLKEAGLMPYRDPLRDIVGMVRTGVGTGSTNHDAIYSEH